MHPSRSNPHEDRRPPSSNDSDCIDSLPRFAFIASVIIVLLSGYAIVKLWDEVGAQPLLLTGSERAAAHQRLVSNIRDSEHDIEDQRDAVVHFWERRVLRHATIFVPIAAFRDSLCQVTVGDMFDKAANPRRIFVGALEQNEHGDPTCVPDEFYRRCSDGSSSSSTFCPADNIRRRRIATRDGRGPTFGRHVAMMMYRDESYVMSIDSHNQFRTHWDKLMLRMLALADSPKPVLSHYPLGWRDKQTDFDHPPYTTVMCRAHFVPFGYVRMGGLNFPNSRRPRRQPWTAAGFLAADARMLHEVPFDKLEFLFDGEELLYSARLWTWGWDSFAPSSEIIWHRYDRMSGGLPAWRFWSIPGLQWAPRQAVSVRRVQWMLRIPKRHSPEPIVPPDTNETEVTKDADKYGLGTVRDLASLWRYAKLDLTTKNDQPGVCSSYFNN